MIYIKPTRTCFLVGPNNSIFGFIIRAYDKVGYGSLRLRLLKPYTLTLNPETL